MKDAAAKIADKYIPGGIVLLPEVHRGNCAKRIRLAIRRAVKAERERCVKCVENDAVEAMKQKRFVSAYRIIKAIQAKRPSRKRK